MSCFTLTGITKACGTAIGGIKSVYLIEYDGVATYSDSTTGVIDVMTFTTGYTGAYYEFLSENSNWVEPLVGDGIVASVHWEPSLTLVFRKLTVATRNEILELSKGKLVAIIQDSNLTYWALGLDRGLQLSASAGGQTGSTMDELNGQTVLLMGKETFPAYSVNITGITLPV